MEHSESALPNEKLNPNNPNKHLESFDMIEEDIEQRSMRKVTDLFRDPYLALHATKVENIPKIIQKGIISSEFAKRATKRGIPLDVTQNEPVTQKKYGNNLVSAVGNLYRERSSTSDNVGLFFRNPDDLRKQNIFEALEEFDNRTNGVTSKECGVLFHYNIEDIRQAPSPKELMLSNRIAPRQIVGLFFDEMASDEKKQRQMELAKTLQLPLYEVYRESFVVDTVNGQRIGRENSLHKYSRDLLQRELERTRGIAQKRTSLGEMAEVVESMISNSPHPLREILWETDEEFQISVERTASQLKKNEWDVSRLFQKFFIIYCRDKLLSKKNYRMIYPSQIGSDEIAVLPQVQKKLQETPKLSNEALALLEERFREQK